MDAVSALRIAACVAVVATALALAHATPAHCAQCSTAPCYGPHTRGRCACLRSETGGGRCVAVD